GIPHPRSSRSSNWWNSRRSQSAGHWLQSGSRDRRSTTGTAATRRAESKLWWMASRDRGGSGTKSPTRSKQRSSTWPLKEPDLSPRELAVNFTDTKGSFVSEATVYRLLKDHGLITSPAFILMKAADR